MTHEIKHPDDPSADEPHGSPPLPPEPSDVGIGLPIAIGLVVLVLTIIGMGVSAWLLFPREQIAQSPPSPLAFLDNPTPAPHLEYSPPADLAKLRAEEDRLLKHYGWVDREKNVVRIPIAQAMKILAKQDEAASPAESASPAKAESSAPAEPMPTEPPAESSPTDETPTEAAPSSAPAAEAEPATQSESAASAEKSSK